MSTNKTTKNTQITVWDYVRYGANDFLGEVLLELANHPLDDEAEWYTLHTHQESQIHTVRTMTFLYIQSYKLYIT